MSRVGENIKTVREKSGLSTKALAKKMGVSEGFLVEVEQGRRVVNEAMIQRFSTILGRNVSELGLDSFESAVFKEEKEELRKSRVKEEPLRRTDKPAAPAVKNDLWDQAFGSNLKNVPIYAPAFDQPAGQRLYPVEAGKIHGIPAEKASLIRAANNELAGYGIYKNSLLLGSPVKGLTQDGFYLVSLHGQNLIRRVRLLGNANVLLLRREEQEITQTVPLKDVKPILQFTLVETPLL